MKAEILTAHSELQVGEITCLQQPLETQRSPFYVLIEELGTENANAMVSHIANVQFVGVQIKRNRSGITES
jgi:hypothetical protein